MSIKAFDAGLPAVFLPYASRQKEHREMQVIKFFLVAVLAVCATQCQAGEYPISADRVDLRLLLVNGDAIAKNMFKAVNDGLNLSKPNVDKILNELAPEARTFVRKLIDEARAKLNEEEKRVNHIFATLIKALDRMKPIKSCYDKVTPGAKKVALAVEKEVVTIIQAVQTKYKKEIDNIKLGTEKTIKKARNLFDTEVEAVIKCLTPGRKDANDCINKELEKTINGTVEVVSDALVLAQTARDTLSPILPEIIEKLLPLLEKTLKDAQALLKTLTDCVATLK